MKRKIKFWKHHDDPQYAGKTFELFRLSRDTEKRVWIIDDAGSRWGVKNPETGDPVALLGDLKDFGVAEGTVDHLVAESIDITPEMDDI